MPRRSVSRYDPLGAYLAGLPPEVAEVTLTLAEVATIVGAPLPRTAWAGIWWKGAATGTQARAWRAAGWRVARQALRADPPAVTFARAA